MASRVVIAYYRFLDSCGDRLLIGGVETYIANLARLCASLGREVMIYQLASEPFVRQYDESTKIIGVVSRSMRQDEGRRALYERIKKTHRHEHIALIFASDNCSVRTNYARAVSIQHGIWWDLPTECLSSWSFAGHWPFSVIKRAQIMRQAVRNANNAPTLVAVDHNFLNWYRAVTGGQPARNRTVIFNAAVAVPDALKHKPRGRRVRILYARRFTRHRGSRLIVDVIRRVLAVIPEATFTLAGEGPDAQLLRQTFSGEARVEVTSFEQKAAGSVNAAHDIALVPSLGSEGTSLSVVEAMSAGCAVVATPIGGVTNLIVDGYNGLLVEPLSSPIATAIIRLATDDELRATLARRGWEAVCGPLNMEVWRGRWTSVLERLDGVDPGAW